MIRLDSIDPRPTPSARPGTTAKQSTIRVLVRALPPSLSPAPPYSHPMFRADAAHLTPFLCLAATAVQPTSPRAAATLRLLAVAVAVSGVLLLLFLLLAYITVRRRRRHALAATPDTNKKRNRRLRDPWVEAGKRVWVQPGPAERAPPPFPDDEAHNH